MPYMDRLSSKVHDNIRKYICHLLFSFTDDVSCNVTFKVITSNYFLTGMLINHEATVHMNIIERKQLFDLFFPITSDKNISTCVNTVQEHQQLQAIFTASILLPRNQLSVDVVLKNVDDCSSPAWTWFVESECRPGVYTECSLAQIARAADLTHCVLTCYCLHSCKLLYLKYNRLPWQNQTSEQLCEYWKCA